MLRCAIKLTHDGTVAVADGVRLLASIEMEKLGNRPRWSKITNLVAVERVLADLDISPRDVDRWIIDGWVAGKRLRVRSGEHNTLSLAVADYQETGPDSDILAPRQGDGLVIGGVNLSYTSYCHVAGHVLGTWAASPFARTLNRVFVLVWDGGMFPRLYRVEPRERSIACLGPLFHLLGHAYPLAGRHFGPFGDIWSSARNPENSVAGRLMAYVALGSPRPDLVAELQRLYRLAHGDRIPGDDVERDFRTDCDGSGKSNDVHRLFTALASGGHCDGVTDADVLLAIHQFLDRLLVERLAARLALLGITTPVDLCFAGGCALNIKWNRSLRASPMVRNLFVPPFPNDSGSAIGMLACELFRHGDGALEWSVYGGPELRHERPPSDTWSARACGMADLAELLDASGEPIVFLHGRAELGPRALGHRSILASARDALMRDRLNRLKGREWFRPVAPVCLEHRAEDIFDPGGRDRFMLFEHLVRPGWVERIPAVVHHDGSARLQTVAAGDEPMLFDLLTEYERRSGVPVLCNTSANNSGCGFFPNAASAARWGGCRFIWAEGTLYTRRDG